MNLEERLEKETLKWMNKIMKLKYTPKDSSGKDIIDNIEAYIKDTNYFLKNKMLIEAFEAIIWAWAWLEIGERLKHIEVIKEC